MSPKMLNSISDSDFLAACQKVQTARALLSDAVRLMGGRATTDDLRAFPNDKTPRDVKMTALKIAVTSAFDRMNDIHKVMKRVSGRG